MSKTEKRKPARVLLVEKDAGVARICQKSLTTERLTTEWTHCPAEALEKLDKFKPQAVILGDDLDGYMSFEVCEMFRARTQVPLLVLTTSDSPGFTVNCLQSGADDVLMRPVEPTVLQAKLHAQLRRAFRYNVTASPRPHVVPSPTPAPVKQAQEAASEASASPLRPAASTTALGSKTGAGPTAVAVPVPAVQQAELTPLPDTRGEFAAAAPAPDFKKWPNCLSCNYMGPRDRFLIREENGKYKRCCPSCGEKRMLSFP